MSGARQRAGRIDVIVLAALGFVAGIGVLTVATVAERAGASPAAPAVLAVFAVVAALPVTVRPTAARRHRVELARRRGVSGPVAGWRALRGLAVAAILGTAVGALGGWVAAGPIVEQVAPGDAGVDVPTSAGVVVVASAAALGLVAVAGAVPLARAPMAELIVPRRVRRDAQRFGVAVRVLLLVAAAVAVYQARSVGSEWRAVAALGLAAVGCGVLVEVGGRWLSARGCAAITSTGVVRPEVALRRIGHPVRGAGIAVVPLVAAAVIAIVVAAGWSTAATWREDTTRIGLGGPVSYRADGGPLRVLEASRRADPDGRWLMAGAVFRDDPDGPERRVYVDTERWGRVSEDFLSGTGAAAVSASVGDLQAGEGVTPVTGDRMTFELDGPDDLTVYDLTISVAYTNDDGDFVNVELPVTDARGDGDLGRVGLRIDDCTTACSVSSVTFGGAASAAETPLYAGPFMLGATDVWETAEWRKQAKSAGGFEPTEAGFDVTLAVARADPRLTMAGSIPVTRGNRSLVMEATSSATLPVIAAGDQAAAREGKLIDGEDVPVDVVATAAALPTIGANGSMFDLSRAMTGHAHSSVGLETFVLARADTPASVVDALGTAVDLGAGVSYSDALASADRSRAAREARMMALVGGVSVLLAAISLLGSTRRLRPALRRESSALHLAGLTTSTVRSIGRWELGLTVAWVACAVLLSSWVTGALVLDALPFIGSRQLIAAPALTIPLGSAIGGSAAVAVVVGFVRWVAVDASASASAGELR